MEKKSTFTPSLQFGLFTGLALIVFSLILFLLGAEKQSYWNLVNYVIIIAGIYWGMTNIRTRYLDNVMSYGKAFGIGFWITLVFAVLVAIFTFFYLKYLDPAILQNAVSQAEDKILAANPNISDADLDRALSMAKTFATPLMSAISQLVFNIIAGAVISLIIAIFAKREDKTIA